MILCFFEREMNANIDNIREEKKEIDDEKLTLRSNRVENRKNSDMVVELFENFQNFMKIQNLPTKNNINTFKKQRSLMQIDKKMKEEMQIIEEDPNENKYTKSVFLAHDDKSGGGSEKKGDAG